MNACSFRAIFVGKIPNLADKTIRTTPPSYGWFFYAVLMGLP